MREIIVFGDKTFKLRVPDDARVTFAPWSPPKGGENFGRGGTLAGTLRVYKTEKDILGVFSGVAGFRDSKLDYSELVTKEEGASIWKSDEHGYEREEKVHRHLAWDEDPLPAIAPPVPKGKGRKGRA